MYDICIIPVMAMFQGDLCINTWKNALTVVLCVNNLRNKQNSTYLKDLRKLTILKDDNTTNLIYTSFHNHPTIQTQTQPVAMQ